MRRTLFVFFIAFFLLGNMNNGAEAAKKSKKSKKKDPQLSFTLIMKAVYDDNVFRYADAEKKDFENHIDSERYPIETIDDLILSTTLDADYRAQLLKGHTTLFSLRLTQYQFWQNKGKDYMSWSFSMIQYFSPQTNFRFNYYYLPERYFRHYYDEDLGTISSATSHAEFGYEQHLLSGRIEHQFFEKLTLSAYYKYGKDYYEENFEEYDAENNSFGIGLKTLITKRADLRCGYGYKESRPKGYDETGETLENSDDRDYSYDQDEFFVRLSLRYLKILSRRPTVYFDFRYRKRDFMTDKSTDDYHYGREDKDYQYRVGTRAQLTDRLNGELFFHYQKRDVDIPLDVDIQEVKNFDRRRFGVGLTYQWQ